MAEDASGPGPDGRDDEPRDDARTESSDGVESDETEFVFGDARPVDDARPVSDDDQFHDDHEHGRHRFDDAGGPDRDSEPQPAEHERIPIDLADRPRGDEAVDDDSDPYGPEPSSTPVEPGDPSLENAIFVFLGAVLMLLVIVRLVSLLPFG
ncbi:DUF7312 domain-containing protein [Natronobeatus ordinarius]|uniref:DUF7312 domain-containing protein n=1 Tax=Natronobeatus ordinarius TaxID=2963433 RepID=UPI0020CDAABD|nr:hypothetical protein [Natronobeatus ordinarius]